ncbi:hypothetical protein QUF89_01805 [Peribacillus simplex]|uniref:Uncharacterized protein n=1 Tax=Peribacillus simplex TaxID=1478 RepID=A0AAW7ILC5_9BACI|nr:hypothetical protein [Peribacillus simplex]
MWLFLTFFEVALSAVIVFQFLMLALGVSFVTGMLMPMLSLIIVFWAVSNLDPEAIQALIAVQICLLLSSSFLAKRV